MALLVPGRVTSRVHHQRERKAVVCSAVVCSALVCSALVCSAVCDLGDPQPKHKAVRA